MQDIFENTVVCDVCNAKTIKDKSVKDGFVLRLWHCPECEKVWYHPDDLHEYNEFNKLRNKNFQVKLRMVGNSYIVSIPREIIEFNEIRKGFVRLSLDGPERLSISFTRIRRKLY